MSESPLEEEYRLRLEEARRELVADGWRIVPADQVAELPVPIGGRAPDIVAQRGAELLVGTVTSRNSRGLRTLNGLADAVAGEPHVSLEVYWLGDEPKAGPQRELVQEYADEAAVLLRSGHARAAVVTAWSALEGVLPYYVADSRAPLPAGERYPPRQAWPLLSQLYSLGYISDADYERLRQLREQRNAAAHLTGGQAPDPGDIEYALDIVARMLDGRYTPGA